MSNIEWTEKTWNPVIGCTPVSPGCLNCYAATMANRMQHMPQVPEYAPRKVGDGVPYGEAKVIRIAEVRNGRAVFTGDVRCLEERLTDPLHWKKPRMIFVNSMSDLFHKDVPFEFVDKVFAVMALCPQHTFQILTKRPERMKEWAAGSHDRVHVAFYNWLVPHLGRDAATYMNAASEIIDARGSIGFVGNWPLPNVWLGTSVEDQKCADERIPHLLGTPAAVRFLSCEPLLGKVDLTRHMAAALYRQLQKIAPCDESRVPAHLRYGGPPSPDWVIVGGESGNQSRPCGVEWIMSIVQQCKAAAVPCFVKQLGAKSITTYAERGRMLGAGDGDCPEYLAENKDQMPLNDRKGGDPSEWPEDLRVRQMPGGAA